MKRCTILALALVLGCTIFTGCRRGNNNMSTMPPATHAATEAPTTMPATRPATEPVTTAPTERATADATEDMTGATEDATTDGSRGRMNPNGRGRS